LYEPTAAQIEVTELEDRELIQSMVGHTITRALWFDDSPGENWCGHEIGYIQLDDGRVIEFSGYGYDAWGADVRDATND